MSLSQHNGYFFTPGQANPQAPLFVFLPGMDETGKDLITLQTSSLETAFDVRCFVIPPDDLHTWDRLAEKVIALTQAELAKLPRKLPVYLCSESFGGCVALKVLLQAPNLFERIILVNPASSFHRVPWLNLGSLLFPLTPKLFYNLSAIISLPFLAQIGRLSPQARQALWNAARSAPKQTAQERLSLLREFEVDETQLQQIDYPVLLIGSQQDHLLPSVAEVKRLAKIFPQTQVVTLPHSGHACLIETDINLYEIMQAKNFLTNSENLFV